ncbi:MAG: amidohydrolase family protein [Acidobacteria bacterium]|nr:amidohydrolase family protein [Acidobacteriota bacterium]
MRIRRPAPALLLVALTVAAIQLRAQTRYDLLIRGGQVVDGSGAAAVRADVGVTGDRIRAVGDLGGATATTVVDASGRYVTAGFIDVHSHAGPGLATAELKEGRPVLAQGITTVLVNPDGGGPVDLAAQRTEYQKRGIGLNVGLMVPHGSVRNAVLGMSDRDPAAADLAKMTALVGDGMRAGAFGLSSGLYYAPGSYSKTAEVIAMAREAAPFGGTYSSHIRDEADYGIGVVAAVDEVITIAEQAGVTGVVTHMKALGPASWGLSKTLVAHIEAARSRGVKVFADQYPYEASGTGIVGALMPRWAQVGGRDVMTRRITGELRGKVRDEVKANLARRGGADTFLISEYEPDTSIEGKRLSDLAVAAGLAPEEYALTLLEKGDAGLVSFNMSESDIALIMQQPWTMTCTDGGLQPATDGKPHPRAYGAFPRKLQRYVRERGVVALPFAIRSMTALAAEVFGMKDRGVVRPGAFADLLVFDLTLVKEVATYEDPHQLAEGLDTIIVNGKIARDRGRFTGALAGRVLRLER